MKKEYWIKKDPTKNGQDNWIAIATTMVRWQRTLIVLFEKHFRLMRSCMLRCRRTRSGMRMATGSRSLPLMRMVTPSENMQ